MSEASTAPHVIVVAGPNGAGKSTSAPYLLRDALEVKEFVNADAIALGLSGFRPEAAAFTAGRVMLNRIRQLAGARENFAFETTLASRSFAPWLERLRWDGYRVHLLFLWLESADLAVTRVAERVRMGGHDVSEAVIRRRYQKGLRNFFLLYRKLAQSWQMFDNSAVTGPRPIAVGDGPITVINAAVWTKLLEQYHDG